MDSNWIALRSISDGASEYRVDDPSFWQELIDEFALDVRPLDPITADVGVFPQAEGVLFRGRVRGRVIVPCDRCSGDSTVRLDAPFDNFEPFPQGYAPDSPSRSESEPEEADAGVIRLAARGGGVEINPAALAWEEFSLALPLKPLCRQDCKGLCPSCGCNLNTENCSCDPGGGDPRLRVLQGLVVHKK
jgi:uncharacterized protein